MDYDFGIAFLQDQDGSHCYREGSSCLIQEMEEIWEGGHETVPSKELLPSNEKFWEKALIRSKVIQLVACGVGGFGHLELDPVYKNGATLMISRAS